MKNFLVKRNNDLFDDFFGGFDDFFGGMNDFFKPVMYGKSNGIMRTDIKENEKEYTLMVEMAGYDKSEIGLCLENGYLTVTATRGEKEENEKFVRRERTMSCKRSYYVGDGVSEKDVSAKFDNGVLNIVIPKKPEVETKTHNIEIQ